MPITIDPAPTQVVSRCQKFNAGGLVAAAHSSKRNVMVKNTAAAKNNFPILFNLFSGFVKAPTRRRAPIVPEVAARSRGDGVEVVGLGTNVEI